ncbi:glycerophosphodiester phosphodiesterase family protein [Actinomadura sp. DC4]|uniref:glycerophosphodiester phosphodiesterase n=1 Tax=Actinomadura sp. DC4 TaxID=3055069 RepID=UPI0025AF6660|nr:glycerophosphodiester phosphodiesterase family protein [Actinomadura sp. DC4]MDN3352720.1 glycerophosphodiester phosphodiesterase family protein [Actinomadura sp. DC4]
MGVAVSAHKGGSEDAPPASWEAYETALTTGAEYVEFDIRRTRDGDLVVFHDPQVAGHPIAKLTYEELCGAAGHRVPMVRDVMKLIAGRAIGHLDLKEIGDEHEVILMALDLLGPGNFVATTLEDSSIRRIKKSFPEVTTALSLGRDLREVGRLLRLPARAREVYPLGRMRACGADWVAVHRRLARANVLRLCGRFGIPAMVWTVNGEPQLRRFLADPRVTVLITDRPRYALSLRTSPGPA